MKQKSLHFYFFIPLLLVVSGMYAQVIPELVFRNPVLESGTALQDGAKYRFPNVTAGVDAIVEIRKRSASNVVVKNIDLTSFGWDKAFQPELGILGTVAPFQSWWVEFEMSFVSTGTNKKKKVNKFDITSLDVDGDNVSIQEYAIIEKPKSISYSSITSLVNSSKANEDECDECESELVSIQGPIQNYLNIDTLGTAVMATYHYEKKDKIRMRIGGKSNAVASNAGMRLNSMWFRSFNLAPFGILPVKLTNFLAKYNKQNVSLTWTTEQEKTFSHFIVERSVNGIDFTEAAVIFAKDNGAIQKDYSFTDLLHTTNKGFIYYRLRLVDVNQKSVKSAIRVIKIGDELTEVNVQAYPNPVVNELRITIPATWQDKPVAYEVFSINGNILKHVVSNNANQTEVLSMINLNAGMYFVKVRSGNETAVKQIMKGNNVNLPR